MAALKKPAKRAGKKALPKKRAPVKKVAKVAAVDTVPVQPVSPAAHLAPHQWQPGQSGNPKGKPKGARNKLSESFVAALFEDFEKATAEGGVTQGQEAIAKVRAEDPAAYIKVIAALAPKQVHIKEEVLDAFDDDELTAALAAVMAVREAGSAGKQTLN